MKTIKMRLTPESVDNVIAELKDYKEDLERKLKILVGRLTQEGVQVARSAVITSQGDSHDAGVDYKVDSTSGEIIEATIWLTGTDALFIEFGAGIFYNTGNIHPKATEFGYGVGTYPGQRYAITPGYWWYRDESKHLRFSLGTEATMPMYRAAETIRNQIIQTAIETFMKG